MQFKADALLLRAADYGENDKMATLLTAERGAVSACFKGVRRAGAKLRFAAQPFCFAEYVFAEKNGRLTVTQAALHDGFYDVRSDISRFYAAACITEACRVFGPEGMECGALLVTAVEALKKLDEGGDTDAALLRFLVETATLAGYPPEAGDCPVCGKKIAGRRYFDMASGAFNCAACAVGVPASESTYEAMRAAKTGETGSADGNLRALRLMKAYLEYQTDAPFPSLTAYLTLPRETA